MKKLHPNVETLRAIYKDLARIAEFADHDIVLHKADRGARGGLSMVIGRRSVQNHELDLIEHTRQTLYMDVHEIAADDHFGSVMGYMRATCERKKIAMPFCGLWRFRDGKIVEHWENVYDIRAFGSFMMGDESLMSRWLCD
ncbi:nuclear transport factor 2 family protein [Pseudomonas viridiflava]|uniref:nuclear transport factor 2 family protein n=1 Tax=Pseudomonas viridiflava TaxID=33069 RepID=UPI000F0447A5|nr:nuclear transport factor 2 family protein [Pseudomonas viridiflava]MBI6680853.1 nuclear transport factor 2 family protein [Pseudomonas viridiflava]